MFRFALILFTAALTTPMMTAPVNPVPYSAAYSVSYRGVNAGVLRFELRTETPGKYIYETRAEPSLLARIIVSDQALERTVMRIDSQGVRPLSWFVEDGKSGSKEDGSLVFSWTEGRVRGTVRQKPVDLPIEPGMQDRLSLQIEVMTAMLRGEEPGTIALIDNDKVKRYSYTRAGTARIKTKAGEYDAICYESTRPGSNRLSRIWHAPALGYIPVRAEQVRDGKVETVMELVEVKRKGD